MVHNDHWRNVIYVSHFYLSSSLLPNIFRTKLYLSITYNYKEMYVCSFQDVSDNSVDAPNQPEEEIDIDLNDPEVEQATRKIQAGFQGMKARKKVQQMKVRKYSEVIILSLIIAGVPYFFLCFISTVSAVIIQFSVNLICALLMMRWCDPKQIWSFSHSRWQPWEGIHSLQFCTQGGFYFS